jgi:hypothetical protein
MNPNFSALRLLVAFLCVVLAARESAFAQSATKPIPEQAATPGIELTSREASPAGIAAAWKVVESMPDPRRGNGWEAKRDERLVSMVRVYALVTAQISQIKPPKVQPSINVTVPGTFEAGVDPGSISDPVVRRQYETAIAENQAAVKLLNLRAEYANLQDDIRFHVLSYVFRKYEGGDRAHALAVLSEIGAKELASAVASGQAP